MKGVFPSVIRGLSANSAAARRPQRPVLARLLPKYFIFVLLPLSAFFLLAACGESPYYEEYQAVPEEGWHKDSAAHFTVSVEDTTTAYAVIFHLRATDDYPYSNLYLFRKISRDGQEEYADTAQVILADQYGKWLGDGLGDLKTFSRPYRAQPLRFNRRGEYVFTFTQAMRNEYLEGVEDLGLTLYKAENAAEKEK